MKQHRDTVQWLWLRCMQFPNHARGRCPDNTLHWHPVSSTNKLHMVHTQSNKAVIDCRLCPLCCHTWSYFKRMSFYCRYIHRDIICKHDVMNIQKVSDLADPGRPKSRPMSVSPLACNRYSYLPNLHVGCASTSWAATMSCISLCASITWSIKLELHNISQLCQKRTERQP